MTGLAWLALVLGLIVFWPATCELARFSRRLRTRHATRTTDARKEKP